jgi:hypothetical protein
MTRERLIPLTLAAATLIALTACSSDPAPGADPTRTTTATPTTSPGSDPTDPGGPTRPIGFASRLQFLGDCPAVLDYMRTAAGERVTAWGLGGGGYYGGGGVVMESADGAAITVPTMGRDAAAEMAPSAPVGAGDEAGFSGTNTQELGVDEGDIVETDGSYIYVATTDGLRIVSVAGADVVAEPDLPQGAHQLLLDGTRLVVITSSWTGTPDTIVSLYDVADPTAPSLLRRSHLEGNVVATRAVDGVARLVVSTSFDQRLPFVQPTQFGLDEEAALARNREIVAESTIENWLPRWFDEAGDGSFGEMTVALPCENVAAPRDFAGLGVTWIASIDTQADGSPVGSAGIVSTGDTVYASTDNLYIATQNWEWQWGGPVPMPMPAEDMAIDVAPGAGATTASPGATGAAEIAPASTVTVPLPATTTIATTSTTLAPAADTTTPETTAPETTTPETTAPDTSVAPETTVEPEAVDGPPPTLIHQFRLGPGTEASYVASGEVEGRLLNQFAMSEFDGDLRVATTTDGWGNFGEQSESTVFVLRPNGTDLEQIGSVGGLGKGEQIYSVRFIDDVGYVVTFRQIDPLYVIDLSDPANPVLEGELKIPGYSAYLHPVGDGLLLGVGQDATDEGRTTGTQLSLFDVGNPADPQRISTLAVGGQSEAEWDHKAFLYWQPDGTIVLPVSPGWNECGPAVDCLADDIKGPGAGAVVAELNGRELVARGVIAHETRNDGRGGGCWNPLQRSIAIGDELATIGLDQVQFSDRQTLEPRDAARWGDPEQYGCYWYWEG